MTEESLKNEVLRVLRSAGKPLQFRELAQELGLGGKAQMRQATRDLEELTHAGEVLCNRRGAYGLVQQMDLRRGKVIGHANGFGFVTFGDGVDWFLPPPEMAQLFPGDTVLVRQAAQDARGRTEAAVVDVLERATNQLIGHFHSQAGIGMVRPHNAQNPHTIIVPPEWRHGAADGQVVKIRVRKPPERHDQALGEVVEILGDTMTPDLRIDVSISEYGLPLDFSEEALAQARGFGHPEPQDGREDCREIPFVTIDGIDARDFDDAVYAKRTRSGYRLLVAIADVSSYVTAGSPLDEDALDRSTSAYFPGRVVPMLPARLADDLCSLRPEVDRYALVCDMTIGADGELKRTKFYPALIRSHARLIYEDVADALADPQSEHPQIQELRALHGLFEALFAARKRRGALDFESDEVKFVLSEAGHIDRVEPVNRTVAHRLIEECMIIANVAAARFLRRHKMGFLSRIHEPPSVDAVAEFRKFLAELGVTLGGGDQPRPKDYMEVLRALEGTPSAAIVAPVLLRSMSAARYAPSDAGHFGLALDDYAHFTSPIRRYPDLMVHRAILLVLAGGKRREQGYTEEDIEHIGVHCSTNERRADMASGSVSEALKCDYLTEHVGDEFEGVVTGVTNFGLFVRIADVRASGLVHISTLGQDYYELEQGFHRLRGRRSGRVFRLGDMLRVRLLRVDAQDRKIDLEPLAHKATMGKGKASTQWSEL